MPAIAAWEDDPHSAPAAEPVGRPVPDLSHSGLWLSFVGRQPSSRVYPMGTQGFRYWTAADSLARAVACWSRGIPGGTRWHAGRPLVGAVSTARIASNYFAQVAAGLLGADERLTKGAYGAAIRRAFVGRGILSMSSAAAIAEDRPRRAARTTGRRADRLRTIEVPIDGRTYGLRFRKLLVEAPLGATHWSAASAAADLGPLAPATPDRASRAFVEDLLRRGRVDTRGLGRHAMNAPRTGRATHALVREGRRVRLVRRRIHARP